PGPNPRQPLPTRQIRLVAGRIGVTDLVITTPDERVYSFEVRVVADLEVLRTQLQAIYPDAALKISQIRDHLIVRWQARSSTQVARIIETIRAYLNSIFNSQYPRLPGVTGATAPPEPQSRQPGGGEGKPEPGKPEPGKPEEPPPQAPQRPRGPEQS